MLLQSLHNPLLLVGILLVGLSLALQLMQVRLLERLENGFKNSRLSADQLDRCVLLARWAPVVLTVVGVTLLLFGLGDVQEAFEAAQEIEPEATYYR
ncbi:hypothetical protein AXK11_02065 [Cephaloticoccus primus]|uniref:Uncharacterized protein n=2 Tax=Cephaloticoccus primus TaxID=1548207 RepID=A0A139SSQ4_9BACT|nr:hypothetical protein AXK11_02065 [Cephaloticoccus primus]